MFGSPQHELRLRRLRRARILLIIFLVVSFSLFFASRSPDNALTKAWAHIETLSSPIFNFIGAPIRFVENWSSNLQERRDVFAQNQSLKDEVARLRIVEQRASRLALRLRQYEQLAGLSLSKNLDDDRVVARLVSETRGPFVHSALINIGRNDGVETGHAAMTALGMYGHVIRAGASSARVIRLNDLNSRVAVMSERSEGRAILSGDNSPFPVLSYIANDTDWREGDRVVTTGDDGRLSQGLPIGRVQVDADGSKRVALWVDDPNVDWVWVYRFSPISEPEDHAVDEETDIRTEAKAGAALTEGGAEQQNPSQDQDEPSQDQNEPVQSQDEPSEQVTEGNDFAQINSHPTDGRGLHGGTSDTNPAVEAQNNDIETDILRGDLRQNDVRDVRDARDENDEEPF